MHCTLHAPFFVFIPKPMYKNDYPDLVIELKWNKAAKTAVEQIRNRKYTQVLEQFAGDKADRRVFRQAVVHHHVAMVLAGNEHPQIGRAHV